MRRLLLPVLMISTSIATGSIRVVTSLPDLAEFVQRVGKDRVSVEAIVRGDQNPHFIEVKPSYMMKLKKADLFFIIGMDLELWARQLVDGSRNEKLKVVDLSARIAKLEIPAARMDASEGDVHQFGNPHYWLDPRNIRVVVEDIVTALSGVSPEDRAFFQNNGEEYLAELGRQITGWEAAMKALAGKPIITFHRSWSYFAAWLGLVIVDQVEPKPGVPPSPSHTAHLIELIRKQNIRAILVEPFYETSAPQQLASSTGARVLQLPTSVGGVPQASSYAALMEYNISQLRAALR